ncbi:MAG: DUF1330 domain-containing protein [Mycobacterium sp.]
MPDTDRHIDPTEAQVQTLMTAAQKSAAPIVMVNLLAFDDEGGRDSYLRYAEAVQPHLKKVGASILYVGDATHTVIGGEDTPWWDTILLVEYPSRAKFLEMVLDPGYQEIAAHRTAALHTSGLIATEQWVQN